MVATLNIDSQSEKYNELYKEKEYVDFNLPDFKITGNKEVDGKNILVLGVGTGRDVRYLVKNNKVWGTDISKQAVKVSSRYNIKSSISDLEKPLKFKSDFFDIVVAKDILEHLNNPSLLADEIRRVLKKEGYAVINVPNHFFLPLRLRVLFGKNLIWKTIGHDHTKLFNEWDYMHKIFFTWKGFQKFLKERGLKIIKTYFDFGTLAHYSQPEFVFTYLKDENKGSFMFSIFVELLKFAWGVFNVIFPRKLRSWIVSLNPSLMCASFYVWCKKTNI